MQIIKLNAIDSTNRYLADLVSKIPLKDYAVVMTQYQSAGQGQRGSNWLSEKGKNLIISILKKNIKTKLQDQFEINMRVSMAILTTLKTFGIPKLSVKWPNDILSDNKKISGVLIQLLTKKQKINQAIIGIGVNVNQTHFDNLPQASSMKSITGTAFDIEALTTKLIAELKYYFDFPNTDKLKSEYESLLFRKNKQHKVN